MRESLRGGRGVSVYVRTRVCVGRVCVCVCVRACVVSWRKRERENFLSTLNQH